MNEPFLGVVFFFFFTLVTGPRRSLSLKLSDTRIYEPQILFGVCLGINGDPERTETKQGENIVFGTTMSLKYEPASEPLHKTCSRVNE